MRDKKLVDRGWRRKITISRHFEGPTDLTLGGYISGLMAVHLDSDTVEVTLRKPTLMERPLVLDTTTPDRVFLYDGDTLLNEARPVQLELAIPELISLEQARKAARRETVTAFPNCFGCGSARSEDEGLHLRSGPVEGRNLVAIDWVPRPAAVGARKGERVPETMVLTAMECPIARAMELGGMKKPEEMAVLGRMTTKVNALPEVGEPCYFMGWPIERMGRRIEIAGTLNNNKAEVLAMCRLTFVVLKEGVSLVGGSA
ncbi:MAG: hypothetical protein A3F75_12005 [Betaproteobacteria bacterium RIFCSPLOWO2_12_FULL_64_23]|nr:MAG: hypothetical protein A3F75_12005 [Betaproteobacteria bacterium RIFCSPLOWO2_12_FULL_64_23]